MIPLSLTSSPSAFPVLKPCYLPSLRPIQTRYNQLKKLKQRKLRDGKCRAELSADAPVAVAIGACILNSLIFPVTPSQEDSEAESLIDSDDARFAVMGIISFIPFFNWMSWVFAWLDTGKRRYAVYAIVYLAPYLRFDSQFLLFFFFFFSLIYLFISVFGNLYSKLQLMYKLKKYQNLL
ncbi:hypothetical protein PHJA_001074900 [Phtheirospermum japonicum]|uniref:Uncharacterized protein n=1 Tax=Phtheirospermum japonicum TaxID=374723 RepID=A0A830BTG5_9LAMI|nr:hypothetical protein PHJA_001074900 [Phtheirospermum japonicum]